MTQVSENNFARFTQNPTYWGKNLSAAEIAQQPMLDPGHVKNVIVYYKPDDLTRFTDLASGNVQVAAISNADWQKVASDPQYAYYVNPPWSGQTFWMALQTNVYPTNITDVRLAIVHAINYSALIQEAYLGLISPYVGPEYPGWNEFYDLGNVPAYSYNITLAKEYLAEANITNMPALTMRALSSAACAGCVTADQIVQADLAQIGINVNIVTVGTWGSFLSVYGDAAFDSNATNAAAIGQIAAAFQGWAPATFTQLIFGSPLCTTNPYLETSPGIQIQ